MNYLNDYVVKSNDTDREAQDFATLEEANLASWKLNAGTDADTMFWVEKK